MGNWGIGGWIMLVRTYGCFGVEGDRMVEAVDRARWQHCLKVSGEEVAEYM